MHVQIHLVCAYQDFIKQKVYASGIHVQTVPLIILLSGKPFAGHPCENKMQQICSTIISYNQNFPQSHHIKGQRWNGNNGTPLPTLHTMVSSPGSNALVQSSDYTLSDTGSVRVKSSHTKHRRRAAMLGNRLTNPRAITKCHGLHSSKQINSTNPSCHQLLKKKYSYFELHSSVSLIKNDKCIGLERDLAVQTEMLLVTKKLVLENCILYIMELTCIHSCYAMGFQYSSTITE